VTAEVDRDARTARWTFTSIDPDTGNTPIDDRGFLIPEDGEGNGQGFARFTVDALAGAANATELTAQATIVFDDQDALPTNVWSNSIDTDTPSASMRDLPAETEGRDVALRWSGDDDGSGVASYDVYVAADGGPLELWRENVTGRTATFRGRIDHRYGFAVTAEDHVGHASEVPRRAETTTRLVEASATDAPLGLVAVGLDGTVYAPRGASHHGDLPASNFGEFITGLDRTATGEGYVAVTTLGRVFTRGDARWFGGLSDTALRAPVVDVAITPSRRGYILLTASGRVRAFGDARSFGRAFVSDAVGIDLTPSGRGYVIATATGRVHAFGDADFHGALRRRLPSPIVGIEMVEEGDGYALVARRGRVYSFGEARRVDFGRGRDIPAIDIVATPQELGYWVVFADGLVRHYGFGRPMRQLGDDVSTPVLAAAG
jgi:hypothetical protein